MEFLQQIKLIQGGMGVYVSNWRLARAVAMERPGETVGTVSGTALDVVFVRLLQLGDPGGHARRAFAALDAKFGTDVGRTICERYFIEGGKNPDARFRSAPMQVVRSTEGKTTFAAPNGTNAPTPLQTRQRHHRTPDRHRFRRSLAGQGRPRRQDLHQLPEQDRPAADLHPVRRDVGRRRRRHRRRRQPRRPAGRAHPACRAMRG